VWNRTAFSVGDDEDDENIIQSSHFIDQCFSSTLCEHKFLMSPGWQCCHQNRKRVFLSGGSRQV